MGIRIGQLGSLKEELKKFTPKRDSKDLTKATRIQTEKEGILQRIELIEQGRASEARWLTDINMFVVRLEKMAGVKIVPEGGDLGVNKEEAASSTAASTESRSEAGAEG